MDKVKHTVISLLPQRETREIYLSLFLESVNQANICGNGKWGVYYLKDRIRLLVGNLIVFTIHRDKIWLSTDKTLLDKSAKNQNILEQSDDWQWDTDDYPEYAKIPSRNGYYTPAEKHPELWHLIRELHFEFIKKTAEKYRKLNKRSQLNHSQALLDYICDELGQPVPVPDYGRSDYFVFTEEIPDNTDFYEGSKQRVIVNAYERNPKARQECIAHYGTICSVCGFDFAKIYGDVGEGFIHVHHLKPLSEIGEEYKVDPITDLCPICPNCHAMIHRRNPPYRVEDIKNSINKQQKLATETVLKQAELIAEKIMHGDI